MKTLYTRAASRLVCAAGSLLGLTLLTGIATTSQAHAQQSTQQAVVSLTSVAAPTHFTSGQNVSIEVGLSGASTPVQITSRPAGIVNFTGTATNGVTLSVPTTAINTNGDSVVVTLVVKTATQTLEVESETVGTAIIIQEPIFPSPRTIIQEPIFPAPRTIIQEPIFPAPRTIIQEPIFPAPKTIIQEPIFPAPRTIIQEPIFPSPRTIIQEPIFPAPRTIIQEPIFPRTIIQEPIFPSPRRAALAGRFRPIALVRPSSK